MRVSRAYLVSKILLADGILLIGVAFFQLLSTPVISRWLARELTPGTLGQISPAFLLNHIVVGVLLIPFGISTLYSAVGVRSGQSWARGIALTNALAVLLLPLFIALFLGPAYFTEPVFLIAAVIVTLIGISMIVPLIWLSVRG